MDKPADGRGNTGSTDGIKADVFRQVGVSCLVMYFFRV